MWIFSSFGIDVFENNCLELERVGGWQRKFRLSLDRLNRDAAHLRAER